MSLEVCYSPYPWGITWGAGQISSTAPTNTPQPNSAHLVDVQTFSG